MAIEFFGRRPEFGQLPRRMRGGAQFAGPAPGTFHHNGDLALFHEATDITAGLVRGGRLLLNAAVLSG